jgi:RHS repeat-associated protein
MLSRRSPLSSASQLVSMALRKLFARGWRRRVLCLVLIFGMLTVPDLGYAVSAASEIAVQVAKDTVAPIPVAVKWFKRLFRRSARPRRQETTADRSASVSSIAITPAGIVGYTGQQVSFTAVGSNSEGQTIQGAQFTWSSADAEKLQIDSSGMASLSVPGLVWVTAATANVSNRVLVLIQPGPRPAQSDGKWRTDQQQLRPDGTVIPNPGTTTGGLLDSVVEHLVPTAHAQTSGGDSADSLYDELWSEPRNLVGSPRNRVMTSSAIGSVLPEGSNFEFSVPIDGLTGRGLSASIALNYNSRVWSRHGSAVTFNAVNTWPYLGFSLSFGRIVTYGTFSATKLVLIDSDGARHYLGSGQVNLSATFQSNDGSHITFVGSPNAGGTLYYNNGVQKTVSLANNRLLVTRVLDANGNYLQIAYKSQAAPTCTSGAGFQWMQAIDTVTDTLGRVVQFNYDTCNNLVSIAIPGYGGTASAPVTTTIARFDYTTATVSTSFSGLTVENVPSGYPVVELSHVYYPATQTGYKFTYSAYGMISTVSLRKSMTYNSSTGAIGDGTEKAYVSYNYPASASSLTDAPSFSQWTQSPAATTGGTATWTVASSSGSGTKLFTITNPDSSTVTLTRSDTSGTDFGLLTQMEVKNSSGTSMAKSQISYTTDGGGQPQVANIVSYDDATPSANQTKVDFDYDSYGNVTNTREYGFKQSGAWVVRRRSHTVYKTDTSYVNAYLRSLAIESDVYDAQMDSNDANDVLMAKTTYTYDDYSGFNGLWDYVGTTYSVGHLSSYGTSYTVRGNATETTTYSDVSAPASTTRTAQFDIFGNVFMAQVSCCNQQVFNRDSTTGYAMVLNLVRGGSTGTMLTTGYVHDFNTSAQDSQEDTDNSLTVAVASRDAALRPTQINLPSGATQTASYNDSTLSVTGSKTYNDGGTSITVSETTDYDGWGRVIDHVDANSAQVNTSYDNMGRVASVTNPFTAGGTPSYSTGYSYDGLGRQTTVTLPDSQTVTTIYSGNSATVTDQVNRKIERLTDGLGRLATVNEQDGSGYLTQATNYSYDALNNLIQVDQGGQLRDFKYDALSRLLYEKIPEQSATINDGSGTYWTSKYTYTDFNAVATRTDARGVVTTNTYDTLNRLTQISYSAVTGVATAPTVTYTYDSYSGTNAPGQLVRTQVGSGYEERYTYDSQLRLSSTIRTIGSRTYTTSYTSYNDANQLTQMTYPSGRVLGMGHDSIGRLSSISEPVSGGSLIRYLHDVSYNLAGQVTGDLFGNGVTEVFGYDAARQQMTSQKAGTTSPYTNRMDLTYSYSASSGQMGTGSTAGNAGQLMTITSSTINGTTESASYTYDNYGRLVTSDQTSNGASAQRRFEYDRWGNRTGVWDATSGGNQIQKIALEQTSSIPSNRIENILGATNNVAAASNGATASASSTYNSSTTPASGAIDGDHKGSNWGSGGGWSDNTAGSYPDWLEVDFSGAKTINEVDVYSIQDNYSSPSEPTESMTFNDYGVTDFQVQYWDGSSWQTVSGGSISGNRKVWRKVRFASVKTSKMRISITGTIDGISRLAEVEAYGYEYDAAGNVTNDGQHTYFYDSENRLTSVDGGAADYAYNQQNRRYQKTVSSTVTHYLWEGGQEIAEHNGSTGAVQVDYIYGGARMIAKVTSSTTNYFLSDRLSARLTLDGSGAVVGRQAHLPFGEDFAESGTQQKQHFTSYERDSETGADYAVNRQYHQGIGRFNRVDPYPGSYDYGNPQSLNRFTYVKNDPLNAVDPLGLDEIVCETDEEGHTVCEVLETHTRSGEEGGGGSGGGIAPGQDSHTPGQRVCDLQSVNQTLDSLSRAFALDAQNTRTLADILSLMASHLARSSPDLARAISTDRQNILALLLSIALGSPLDRREIRRIGANTRDDVSLIITVPNDPLAQDLRNYSRNLSVSRANFKAEERVLDSVGECPNLTSDQKNRYNQLNSQFARQQKTLGVLYNTLNPGI